MAVAWVDSQRCATPSSPEARSAGNMARQIAALHVWRSMRANRPSEYFDIRFWSTYSKANPQPAPVGGEGAVPQRIELTNFELRELLLKHRPRDITEEKVKDMLKICDEHDPSGTTVTSLTLGDSDVAFIQRLRRRRAARA
jgi:hypothetical protein